MDTRGAVALRVWSIRSPKDTMLKTACEQAHCEMRERGWESHIDESTQLGRAQAHYIRHESGRTFTEHRTGAGITVFRFEPGQRCFEDHYTLPERFFERTTRGGVAAGPRVAHSPAGWVDAMDGHLHGLKEVLG